MPERTLRLLIAEKEYLIAIDASQILSGWLECDATVVAMAELESRLAGETWDLVLIDVAGDAEGNRRNAGMALAAGASLVFLTGHIDLAQGVPGFAEWPVVIKPFAGPELIEAALRALSLTGKI